MYGACGAESRGPARRLTRLWAALVTLGLAAALAGACDGGGDREEPTGQATTSAACQALASLKSYRYVSKVTLESPEEPVPFTEGQPTPVATLTRRLTGRLYFDYNIDASLVAPDRVDAIIQGGTGTPFNLIAIGDKHWVSLKGQWQEVGDQYTVPYKPMDVCAGIFPQLSLDPTQGEKETVNTVAARHYTFAAVTSGRAMATIFGPGSDMDVLIRTIHVEVWVAEKDGWPVRMDVQGSGVYSDGRQLRVHVRVELRDINDKDIKVEPPI